MALLYNDAHMSGKGRCNETSELKVHLTSIPLHTAHLLGIR